MCMINSNKLVFNKSYTIENNKAYAFDIFASGNILLWNEPTLVNIGLSNINSGLTLTGDGLSLVGSGLTLVDSGLNLELIVCRP